jgi:hypothetical protein
MAADGCIGEGAAARGCWMIGSRCGGAARPAARSAGGREGGGTVGCVSAGGNTASHQGGGTYIGVGGCGGRS